MRTSETHIKAYFAELQRLLAEPKTTAGLLNAIANAPFHNKLRSTEMGLGIVVLTLANRPAGTIDRVALSATEPAKGALRMTSKPFHDIKIPISHPTNTLAKVVADGHWHQTDDWQHLFEPELTAQESRFNQAGAGIECSVVYPLMSQGLACGAMIFSYFEPPQKIGNEQHAFMQFYSQLAAKALEQSGNKS